MAQVKLYDRKNAFEPREFIAHGDKVVALGHYAWRVKSTGREFGGDFAHVFTMSNGKVIRFHHPVRTRGSDPLTHAYFAYVPPSSSQVSVA